MRYGRQMATRTPTAQEHAEGVLAQIESAIHIADLVRAPATVVDELRRIHRLLHQRGLSHNLQGSFF